MNIEFIKTPYTTSPGMKKNKGEVFTRTPREYYLSEKKKELHTWGERLHGTTKEAKEKDLVKKLSDFCGLKQTSNIKEVALQLEEDIAIMYNGKLSSICFCFPSNWVPTKKLGQGLKSLHQPVGDGEQLLKASSKISNVMQKQKIIRWIWTITTSSSLSNYPEYKKPDLRGLESLYLRVETQTTAPLTKESSLFFVRVDVVPLKEVWSQDILDSVNSMTEEVLVYKNLLKIKELLNSIAV